MKSWFGASAAINSSLEPSLAELVKIRASQINGCANCLNEGDRGVRHHSGNPALRSPSRKWSSSFACLNEARRLAVPAIV